MLQSGSGIVQAYLLIIVTLVLQVVAIVLAARLFHCSEHKFAWGLVALAIVFMAGSYVASLLGVAGFSLPGTENQLIALVVSTLLLAGIYSASPLAWGRQAESPANENKDYLHEALQLVSRSEERYRVLFNNGNDAVFVYNVYEENGLEYSVFTEVNDVACRMLGYTRLELLMLTPYDILPEGHGVAFDKPRTELLTRVNKVFETVFVTKSGSYIPVEVSTRRFNLQGEQTLLAFVRDISERKAAEKLSQKFGRILDRSANELYIFDADSLLFIQVSQGALDNLGYTIEEIRKLHGYDLKSMSRQEFEEILKPLRSGEKQQIRFLAEHTRKDATTYKIEANLQLLSQETPPVFVGVITDVTERVRVESRLREWQSEFAHASRLATVGSFSTELAHELNQPLSAITNYVRGTLRRFKGGELDEQELPVVLERISDQTRRAVRIMQRLREFVHYEQEPCSNVDIASLIRGVVEYMQADISQNGIDVSLQLQPKLPGVCVEPLRLEQVLVNLLQNAIIAMEHQTQRRLTIDAHMHADNMLLVKVSDTGVGIPQENLERILEPFATTRADGIGLGLPISRSIVESYGGHLWIESAEAGRQTTFCFSLPVEEVVSVRSA